MSNEIKIPKNINKEARDYLESMISKLREAGALESVDSEAIKMLGYNLNTFYEASNKLLTEGYTVTSDRGNVTASPWVKIQKDAQNSAMKVMQNFGLTLASREKIKKFDGSSDDDSPLTEFFKGKK